MIRFVQALEPRRLLSGAPSDPAVAADVAGLKADVASWKTTHQTDMTTLHADMLALRQARKAAH